MICVKCDRELPIERFAWTSRTTKSPRRRSRRCSDCKRTATCNVKRWHKKGRDCSRCGQVRPCPAQITDFPWRPAVCKDCIKAKERARQREWAAEKRANDPDFRRRQIDATIRWQQRNREYRLEAEKRRHRAIRSDPQRLARRREDQRMRYRMRREQAGNPTRPVSQKTYIKRYGRGSYTHDRVAVEPLMPLLLARDPRELAESSGLNRSTIDRLLTGRNTDLMLPDADKLCVALGIPISLIYAQWDQAA